jgi:hypothetical protein
MGAGRRFNTTRGYNCRGYGTGSILIVM